MMARSYVLDGSTSRLENGRVVLGGSPLRLFTLTPAGSKMLDRLVAGQAITSNVLLDRLLDAGAIHPAAYARRIGTDSAGVRRSRSEEVTVVVPAWRSPVDSLVAALGPVARVIVVDDASPTALAAPASAEIIRRRTNGGPGAARQTGLAAVTTEFVAFVDSDVLPTPGWLEPLLAHFDDERVALVAPRVVSRVDPSSENHPSPSVVDRYEAARSPLDLGPAAGPVLARTRISYVPSAAWVVRTDALRAIGGFDPQLRTGEDVDVVWRLVEAGWRARYEPASVVHHTPRPTLRALLGQRASYGRSAAPLAQRHRGALAPVGVSGWSAAAWTLAATGLPGAFAGAAVALGSTLALPRKLKTLTNPRPVALRLAGLGHLHAGRQLASAITKVWWPLALVAAVVSKRARRAVLLSAVLPALADWRRSRPSLDPARYTAIRVLDDAAYGFGVWRGVIEDRTLDPLIPDFSSWPRRSSYEQAPAPQRALASQTEPPPA